MESIKLNSAQFCAIIPKNKIEEKEGEKKKMDGLEAVKNNLFFVLLLLAARIDLKEMRIPNWLLEVAFILRVSLFIVEWIFLKKAALIVGWADLLGSMVLTLGLTLVSIFIKSGLGFGDVKLLGVFALYLGAWNTLRCFWYSLILAAVLSLFLLLKGKISRKDKLPLAPFFLMGYILMFF